MAKESREQLMLPSSDYRRDSDGTTCYQTRRASAWPVLSVITSALMLAWASSTIAAAPEAPAPAAIEVAADRVDVFVVGRNSRLVQRVWTTGGWSGWTNLGGDLRSGIAAIATSPNRAEVFARDASCRLQTRTRLNGQWAQNFENLNHPLEHAPAVARVSGSVVHLFSVNGAGDLAQFVRRDEQWAHSRTLPGELTSAPSVVAAGPFETLVFARDRLDRLVMRRWRDLRQTVCAEPPCSAWSQWINLGGTLSSGPSAIVRPGGRVDVFARGSDNQLLVRSRVDSSWRDWVDLGGQLSSAPAAVSRSNGDVDVFARSLRGTLIQKRLRDIRDQVCEREPCSAWTSWRDLGGSLRKPIGGVGCGRDDDRDGLQDSYEDRLLQRFAPVVWLHEDESSKPVNVPWLLRQSRLRFSHGGGCPDHGLIDWFAVQPESLLSQVHRNVDEPPWCWPWNCCDHQGSELRSDEYTAVPKRSFFLQFTDRSHGGLDDSREWVIYGHVYPARNGEIAIQFWQLYAYNDSIQSFNHEGDWEFSAVRINRDEELTRVAHYRHGRVVDNPPGDVEWVGDHHVSYSAKGSHSQYAKRTDNVDPLTESCDDEGVADALQGDLVARDKCGQGIEWRTWGGFAGAVRNVGEKGFPRAGARWIRFSGRWGEIGAAAVNLPGGTTLVEFTSGPQGPAYQEGWTHWGAREVCDNEVDDDVDGTIDEAECRE